MPKKENERVRVRVCCVRVCVRAHVRSLWTWRDQTAEVGHSLMYRLSTLLICLG